jgi:hypothetical protein
MTPKDPAVPASHVIVLHLTDEQHRWLENTAAFLAHETGCEVSHSSIMIRLMAGGLPAFEQEIAALRAKSNSNRKRFNKLQLVYTRVDA